MTKETIRNKIKEKEMKIFLIDLEYDFTPYNKWVEKQQYLNEIASLYQTLYAEFPEEKPKPIKIAKNEDDWFPDGWI